MSGQSAGAARPANTASHHTPTDMLERVVSRRGKFSPRETDTRDKDQIIPLPVTGNNRPGYDPGDCPQIEIH